MTGHCNRKEKENRVFLSGTSIPISNLLSIAHTMYMGTTAKSVKPKRMLEIKFE